MYSVISPSGVCILYSLSLLLALAVLTLSLLDLGFGSLFLGIVGPCVAFMHHGCTAFLLGRSGTTSLSLIATANIVTIGLLAAVWLIGSIVVIIWGSFYLDGSAQMVAQAVGTPGTVVAQGVVGVLESLVLSSLFATLIRVRRQERSARVIQSHEATFPYQGTTSPPLVGKGSGSM